MKKILILPVLAVLILALLYNNAYASTHLTGTVTRCTGYYACNFTVNNSTGTGYVNISSPTVTFKLPGESNVTTSQVLPYGFSGQSVNIGSSTAGTLYNVTGKFTATDANSGRLVTGSTDVVMGVKSKSGRGGGTTYTVISGSINVLETDKISGQTITTATCNPSTFIQGGFTKCTVTVTNQAKQNTVIPTGTVSFTASNTGLGSFSPTSCTLSSGSCSVNFISNQEYGSGTTSIYPSYRGDTLHTSSSGSTPVYVTPCSGC